MRLPQNEVENFYKRWRGLTQFVDSRHHLTENQVDLRTDEKIDPEEMGKVADYLWKHLED